MFVADRKQEQKGLGDPVKVVALNKTGSEYFASVINQQSLAVFEDIPRILGSKKVDSDYSLLRVSLILSHANKVVLAYTPTTGCQQSAVLGIMAVCQALLTLGKGVNLVVNDADQGLFDVAVVNCLTTVNAFQSNGLSVLSVTKITRDNIPAFDCLLTIEAQYNIIQECFEIAQKSPHINVVALNSTEGICTPVGAEPECTVVSESVSTSAYALTGGLYAASTSPCHWRYKNFSINPSKPSHFNVNDFIPTDEQVSALYWHYRYSIFYTSCIAGSSIAGVVGGTKSTT